MENLNDPFILRAIERYLIVIAAMVFAVLGYRLFANGVKHSDASLSAKGKGYELVFSGKAPGLFFMLGGAIIMIFSLATGGVSREVKPGGTGSPDRATIETMAEIQKKTEDALERMGATEDEIREVIELQENAIQGFEKDNEEELNSEH